ncbi:MAG: hypothetical protein ACE361_22270 [Aureliella sp.]
MFELQILLANVLAPIAIFVFAIVLDFFVARPANAKGTGDTGHNRTPIQPIGSPIQTRISALIASAATALAIWTAFGMRNEFVWWSEDYWQQIPIATATVAFGSFIAQSLPRALHRWLGLPICFVALNLAANLVTPQGESWADVVEPRILWLSLLVVGPLLSSVGLTLLPPRIQACVLFGWIAAAVASAFLAAQSFMKVTEPMLACATCFGMTGVYCSIRNRGEFAFCVALPATFALATLAANGQFNSYLGLSNGITYLAMMQTALTVFSVVVLVNWLLPGRSTSAPESSRPPDSPPQSNQAPLWKTLGIVLGLSVFIAAATILWTGSEAGFGEDVTEEEW